MKKKHTYLAKIDNELWDTIQNLKTQLPENVSVNTLINKGLSVITKEELLNLSVLKRNKESLSAMRGI